MAYMKMGSSAQSGRAGVIRGSLTARKFAGVPFIWVSKYGSKRSNSGTTDPRARWWKRYQDNNNARQCKLSRNG